MTRWIHLGIKCKLVKDRIGYRTDTDAESTDSAKSADSTDSTDSYRFLPILINTYRYLSILPILTDSVESVRIGKNQ